MKTVMFGNKRVKTSLAFQRRIDTAVIEFKPDVKAIIMHVTCTLGYTLIPSGVTVSSTKGNENNVNESQGVCKTRNDNTMTTFANEA